MRLVELLNTTGAQLNIRQLPGMVFAPGETKKVSPATLKHPAVSQYIGRGLELVTSLEKKEEPKAPVPPIPVAPVVVPAVIPVPEVPPPPVPAPVPEPVKEPEPIPAPVPEPVKEPEPTPEPVPVPAEPMPEETVAPVEVPDETVGTSLRDEYLSAPGVNVDNVDEILSRYPTYKKLANAKKTDLTNCGVSKADTADLKNWALDRIS